MNNSNLRSRTTTFATVAPKKRKRIDKSMKAIIELINKETSLQTLGCCCGHGIYPMTVVVKKGKRIYELMTGIDIPRKRLFYQRDKKGVFYIPELVDGKYGWNHRR